MIVEITNCKDVIKDMLSDVYEQLSYDNSPPLEKFEPKGVWFMLIKDSKEAGFISFDCLNNILWTPHIYIKEEFRGKGSEEWGKQAAQYMRETYGAKKFLVMTPYKAAKNYAKRVGFTYVTTLTKSIKKDGKLLDQNLIEME
jgi:hypothetical protein